MEYQGGLKVQFCNFVFLVCGLCCFCFSYISIDGIIFFIFFELVFVPVRALILI